MKKAVGVVLAIIILICFSACGKNQEKPTDITVLTTSEKATTERVEKTTAKPTVNEKKGRKLEASLKEYFSDVDGYSLEGDFNKGGFLYKFNRDAEIVYANERTEAFESNAKSTAKELVDEIKSFYGDEIKLESFEAKEIGNGDNGIDSVVYVATYVNTQNQALVIQLDSDGVISYVKCDFTW